MFKIGNVLIKNPIIIAPMAGISNAAFRELCYEFDAGLTVCEMVSDKAIYYRNLKTQKMLEIDDDFHPVSMQIFGADPDIMASSAKYIQDNTNADIIDINMGCPVNKIVKSKGGSSLLKNEDLAIEIVRKVVNAVSLPVTVKMRTGWDKENINCIKLAKEFEKLGVKAITLHGRTRNQMYQGKADWEIIKQMKQELSIPVIGNGDIKTVEDFIYYKEYSKVDGIMIARAVVGNPFLITEILNYLNGKENYQVSVQDKLKACLKHASKLVKLKGEQIAISEMRGLASHYINGLYNCAVYKSRLSKMQSFQELSDILNEYKQELIKHQSLLDEHKQEKLVNP